MNYLGGFCLPGGGQWPACPTGGGSGSSEVVPAPGTSFAGIPVIRGGAEEIPEGNHSLVQGFLTPGMPQSHQNVWSSYYRA